MVEMPDLVHNLILRKIFGSIYIVVLKKSINIPICGEMKREVDVVYTKLYLKL